MVHQPSFEVARCVYVDLGTDIPQRFRKNYAAHEVLIAIDPFHPFGAITEKLNKIYLMAIELIIVEEIKWSIRILA